MRNARSARRPRLAVAEAGGEGYEIEEEEEEVPALSLWAALILLVVVTVIIGFTAEFLLDGLQGLTDAHPEVSQEWVGLILLPIVGNAAEVCVQVSVAGYFFVRKLTHFIAHATASTSRPSRWQYMTSWISHSV